MKKRPLQTKSLNRTVARIIKEGGVGILPTDTLYGIVASVFSREAVARVYRLRRRDPQKPSIILISGLNDLRLLGVRPTSAQMKVLRRIWPGKFSVVLKTRNAEHYLDRGTGTLAFRYPRSRRLQHFLRDSGPIIAPSANWEGYPPALSLREAKRYFNNRVDFYVNAGQKRGRPSTLIAFEGRRLRLLRPGAGKLPKTLEYDRLG